MVVMATCIKQYFEKQLNLIKMQPLELLLLPLFVFLLFLYKWLPTKSASKKNLPPSPPKLPVLGNLHQLSMLPHRSLHSLSKRYGELMLFHVSSMPTLIVSSARAAREILKTHDVTFADRPARKTSEKLLYSRRGLSAGIYGENLRQMRKVCVLHLLSSKRVRSFRNQREEEISLVIEKINQAVGSSTVNLSELFLTFANDMICKVALGKKYGEQEYGMNLHELLKEFLMLLSGFNVGDFIPCLAWVDRINGWDSKVDKIAKEFDQFLEKVVKEHWDHSDNSKDEVSDFVDVLLNAHKDNSDGFFRDRECIKALLLDLFIGGTEPTSSLLEWTMTELLKNPQIMQTVQREVRTITGKNSDVKEHELEQMKYLKAVIKETLRLHPPGPMYPRQSIEEANIHGYDIPAGTAVFFNVWAIHRDSKTWDDPETFNPERFLNSSTDDISQDFHLLPFGAGKRMCPAIFFATASITLLLANLVHKFDWTLPEGETLDMSECYTLNLPRKNPLLAVATAHYCT